MIHSLLRGFRPCRIPCLALKGFSGNSFIRSSMSRPKVAMTPLTMGHDLASHPMNMLNSSRRLWLFIASIIESAMLCVLHVPAPCSSSGRVRWDLLIYCHRLHCALRAVLGWGFKYMIAPPSLGCVINTCCSGNPRGGRYSFMAHLDFQLARLNLVGGAHSARKIWRFSSKRSKGLSSLQPFSFLFDFFSRDKLSDSSSHR